MAKIERTSVEQAYKVIRSKIAKGQLPAGQRVSQRKLAKEIGCSQIPVAEAMRRLESDGLLVKEPLKMAKVREFSLADLEGLYLIREGLESMAARLCAERITDAQIEQLLKLEQGLERAIRQQANEDYKEIDVEIHRLIYHCAGCGLLEQELKRLLLLEHTAANQSSPPAELEGFVNRHRALICAITDRDADSAEYLAKKHVATGRYELLARSKE